MNGPSESRSWSERVWAAVTGPNNRVVILYGVAYLAAAISLGSFLLRGEGEPSRFEFALLLVVLAVYLYFGFESTD